MGSRTRKSKRNTKGLKRFTVPLSNSRLGHNDVLLDLKTQTPTKIRKVLDQTLHAPHVMRGVYGSPFPSAIGSLCKHEPLPSTGDLEAEVRWAAITLARYADRINRFLSLRSTFARTFLSGQLEESKSVLTQIKNELGVSLWLLEASLLLVDTTGGLKENRKLYTNIFEQTQSVYVKVLVYLLSLRSEEAPSASSFDAAVRDYFSGIEGDPVYYLQLRSNPHALSQYTPRDLAAAIARDAQAAVVDRYLLLLRALQIFAALRNGDPGALDAALGAIEPLSAAINDPALHLLLALGRSGSKQFSIGQSDGLHSAIDSYTVGHYDEALAASRRWMEGDPSDFTSYELWSRSALHSYTDDRPLASVSLTHSPRRILEGVFRVLEGGIHADAALLDILKLSYRLDALDIGLQLFAFYLDNRLPPHPVDGERLAALTSHSLTPRTSLLFTDAQSAESYLDAFKDRYASSPTVQLFRDINSQVREHAPRPFSVDLPQARRLKYQALVLDRCGMFQESSRIYAELRGLSRSTTPTKSDASAGLYRCAWELGQVDECVALAVDSYIMERNFLTPSKISDLVRRATSTYNLASASDPALPILLDISRRESSGASDSYPVFVAYDEFLSAHSYRRPSDLRAIHTRFSPARVAYFLRYVCISDVMDWSTEFHSAIDLEDERVAVCQVLIDIDPRNADAYLDEISETRKHQAVRTAVRRADRSKIFIDTGGIRASFDDTFRESFERLAKLQKLDPSRHPILSDQLKLGDTVIVVSDEATQLFKRMFVEVRNRFISSNEYGLDSYLSVRVRHGTLEGQIRSQFEQLHLVTRRDSTSGRYEENTYWQTPYPYAELEPEPPLPAVLEEFSAGIDALIEEVKAKWVQIRSEEHPDGFFDFEYTEEDILVLSIQAATGADFDEFLNILFQELWNRTETNVAALRKAITDELQKTLTEELDGLRARIEKRRNYPGELLGAIAACRTAIQGEVDAIAGWFDVGGEAAFEDFNLRLAIDTTIEIVRNTFPTAAVRPIVKGSSGRTLSGSTFPHLLDLLYIPLENIVRHARPQRVESEILVEEAGDRLSIRIRNALARHANVEEISVNIPAWEAAANDRGARAAIRKEGGSGFFKLGKILEHDLKCKSWHVSISIAGDRFEVAIDLETRGIAR